VGSQSSSVDPTS